MPTPAEIESGDFDPTVRRAIDKVFSDTSVAQQVTYVHLANIVEYIKELQANLDEAQYERHD